MKTEVINIEISGNTQTGKTAVLQSIKKLLESYDYTVIMDDLGERKNPSDCIDNSDLHEKPSNKTVFILSETGIK